MAPRGGNAQLLLIDDNRNANNEMNALAISRRNRFQYKPPTETVKPAGAGPAIP
jgi:hypothetical protein